MSEHFDHPTSTLVNLSKSVISEKKQINDKSINRYYLPWCLYLQSEGLDITLHSANTDAKEELVR